MSKMLSGMSGPLVMLALFLSSCTGGQNALPTGAGSIRIAPGDELTVDLTDVIQMGVSGFNVSLKSVSNDFQTYKEFHDVTALAKEALAQSQTSFTFVVPKNLAPPKPFVIVVDIPELQEYLLDAVFEGQSSVRPGIASRLTFDLMESFYTEFTPRSLGQYSSEQYTGIRGLIQDRVESLHSQSEHLSYSSLPFAKMMRFYKNSLAFNPAYLEQFKARGVRFAYDRAPITGVTTARIPADQTLESCFRGFCYEYAKNFRVILPDNTERPAIKAPFKHDSNAAAQMMAGAARPNPSVDLTVNEKVVTTIGEAPAISVTAQGFDLDEDYMEKSMRVIYTPRRLPAYWKNTANRPLYSQALEDAWSARHPSTDQPILGLSSYDLPDTYTLQSIDYDEALDPSQYLDPNGNNVCGDCQTATREVFYFVTDGMAWLPYRWKFSYIDQNRQPQFILNEQGGINSTHFDEFLRVINGNEQELPNVPGWRLHASHCENDPNATPTPIPQAGPGNTVQTLNYYSRIKNKSDGPWSCAFSVYDPDIRDDPNGAPDEFYFSALRENDPFTMINLGARLDPSNPSQLEVGGEMELSWPPLAPATMESPLKQKAMTESSDPSACGANRRCATGLAQVIIDNAVKNAAESQANQTVDFIIRVYDRKNGGQSSQRVVSRGVQFMPNPPLLVNFSSPNVPVVAPTPPPRNEIILDENQKEIYWRTETFASEIKTAAKVHSSEGASFDPIGISATLLDPASRATVFTVADIDNSTHQMSPYITQPHTQCDSQTNANLNVGPDLSFAAADPNAGADCRGAFGLTYQVLNVTSFRKSVPVLLGSTLRKTKISETVFTVDPATLSITQSNLPFDLFKTPREQDPYCKANTDTTGTWDQRSPSDGYLGLYNATQSFYSFPQSLPGFPAPTATPIPRTPLTTAGFAFEINAVDYDNVDLRSGEPADPVFLTLETDQAVTGQFKFCHPYSPNLDSRLGETYLPTNAAGTNGIDPDACQTWSDTPPLRMQPVPVFYNGTNSAGNPTPRKMVYHRLRALWTPRDQGREKKFDNPDPKGLIRNFISSIRLNGNVYAQKLDTRDKTEPFDPSTGEKIKFPVFALKRELPACFDSSSTLVGKDTLLYDVAQDSGAQRFSILDGNHVNRANPSHDGAVTGRYEADLTLMGESDPSAIPPVTPRSVNEFETLKFVPHTIDCSGTERRSLSRSPVTFKWLKVKNAVSYQISYNKFPPSYSSRNSEWVTVPGNVAETGAPTYSLQVPDLDSYRTYYFRYTAALSSGGTLVSTEVPIQANPDPAPSTNASITDSRLPAIWYRTALSSEARIRFKGQHNSANNAFCIRHTLIPVKDGNDIPYTAVWTISRRSPDLDMYNNLPIRLKSPWLETCTGRSYIDIDPYAQELYVAVKNVTHTPTGFKCVPSNTAPGFPLVFEGRTEPLHDQSLNEVAGSYVQSNIPNDPRAVQISLAYRINPDAPEFGALTSPTPAPPLAPSNFRLDWFPSLYGADIHPTVTRGNWLVRNLNAANALFFKAVPYNTFIYDTKVNSPTRGRSTFLGFTRSQGTCTDMGCTRNPNNFPDNKDYPYLESARAISTNAADTGGSLALLPATPSMPREHHYSVSVVDFDTQPSKINVANMVNDPTCSNAGAGSSCFRMKGDNTLQLFAWAPEPAGTPTVVSYTFRAFDQTDKTEDDPYDVLTYMASTPFPLPTATPVNFPNLVGLGGVGGRADCLSKPANYPATSTLSSQLLDSYKKCTVQWSQTSADAGKEFKFDLWVQDNFGAVPTPTPSLMGAGGKHPINSTSVMIPFFWDAERVGGSGANTYRIVPVGGTSATVQYTVDPPDAQKIVAGNWNGEYTTYDSTLSTCQSPNWVCYRDRAWTTVSATSCNQSIRLCNVTVAAANIYKRHWFRTSQNSTFVSFSTGLTIGAQNPYVNNGLIESNPHYLRQPIPAAGGADASAITNGPLTKFTLELYSLERNNPPFFTQTDPNPVPPATPPPPITANAKYSGANSGNWTSVFTSSQPGGAGVAPNAACLTSDTGRFNCGATRLQINSSEENYLYLAEGATSVQAIEIEEVPQGGTKYNFSIYARDIANLTALKTLQVQAPTQVYVVDGPNRGSSYTPASFSGNAIEWQVTSGAGWARANFKWAPTDLEAHALSNSGGFLIPIRVSDSKYDPSKNESGFNSNFIVGAKTATIWVWCKLKVRNNPPTVTYFADGVWSPLNGAVIQFQTGTNTPIKVRVTDTDTASWTITPVPTPLPPSALNYRTFFPSGFFAGNPTFTSASPLTPTNPTVVNTTPKTVIQEFNLNATPTNANIGLSQMTLTYQDPGDPSLGLAVNSDSYNWAQTSVAPVTFFVNVVGKPDFRVPAPPVASQYTRAHSYALYPMNYPLSLFITRPNERTDGARNFFMGIQVKPAPTVPPGYETVPLASVLGNTGFHVNESYMLRIVNGQTFNATADNQNRLITLGAVVEAGNCNANRTSIDSGAAVTLVRVRENTPTGIQYCNISATNAANNLAVTQVQHTLHMTKPTLPALVNTSVQRSITVPNAADPVTVNREFRDFQKRCIYCTGVPASNTGFTLWNGEINGISGVSPTLSYSTAQSQNASFLADSQTNTIRKSYEDTSPAGAGRTLRLTAFKGDVLEFGAQIDAIPISAGKLYARWYVNGCLRATHRIESTNLLFQLPVASDSGGRNDDCSGQFQRVESNTDELGVLRVSLRIADGSELAGAPSPSPTPTLDASPMGYSYLVTVVNNQPMVQLTTGIRANPRALPLTGLYTTATSTFDMKFLMPFTGGGRNLFLYTDKSSATTTNIRVRELMKNGGLGSLNITLPCANFSADPNWIGLESGPFNLKVSMVNSSGRATDPLLSAYPTNAPASTYGQQSTTCYRSWGSSSSSAYVSGTIPSASGNPANQASAGNATVAAGVLAYAPFTSGSRAFTSWKDGSGGGYVIDGVNASSDFWSASFPVIGISGGFNSAIYGTGGLAALDNFVNNTVHRNTISDGKLFQAIGHDPAKAVSDALGHVVISSLAANGKTVAAGVLQSIAFGPSGLCNLVDSDSVNRSDRIVPLDLVYHAATETLLVLASDNTSTPKGRLIEISNALSSPSCRQVTDNLLPPSRFRSDFNTAIDKLVIDANGVAWGVITKSRTEPGEVFTYDLISRRPPVKQSLSFPPHSILYSPGINSFHIPSHIPTFTSPVSQPTLYRVW